MHHPFVAWITVPVLADLWHLRRLTTRRRHGTFLARRSVEVAAAVVRLVATGVGYLLVLIAASNCSVSRSPPHHRLRSRRRRLGIAAQQSLAIFSLPRSALRSTFNVGEHIRVRSGTIGVVDAWVLGIGLTYVTLQTEDGLLKVPNSVVLASGIGKLDTPPNRLP